MGAGKSSIEQKCQESSEILVPPVVGFVSLSNWKAEDRKIRVIDGRIHSWQDLFVTVGLGFFFHFAHVSQCRSHLRNFSNLLVLQNLLNRGEISVDCLHVLTSSSVESGDSSQSLLSRRQSEIGSRYVVESGFFMSSFTATVFITAVLAIGVLMLTLLIVLTVMLESCQSNGSGVLNGVKKCEQHDYCSLFVFHAELNNLDVGEFPMICKSRALQIIQERYLQNLNTSLWFVEEYFSALKPNDDGLDVILLDADDILSLNGNFSRISSLYWKKQFEDMKLQASVLLVRLQMQLRASNWSFILFTRKPAEHFNTTWSMLTSSGYAGWSSLIMRSDDEIQMESWEYLTSRRLHLQKQGFRFAGLISSQLDAFRGTCLGRRNFKLPDLLYYEL